MSFLTYTISSLLLLSTPIFANENDTSVHKNTKRTASDQIYNHGETKPVVVYLDNISSQSSNAPDYGLKNFYSGSNKPLALVSVQQPIQVFEQDNPKQVAAQQVSYEFQKTPTNAVSNVHVQQLFQTDDYDDNSGTNPTIQPQHPQAPGYVASAETVVSPVHHNSFTSQIGSSTHNPLSHFTHNSSPLNSQSTQFNQQQTFNSQPSPFGQQSNTFYQPSQFSMTPNVVYHNQRTGPGKYLYLNGKIVYQPNSSPSSINLQPHATKVHPVNLVNYNFGHAPLPHHGISLNSHNPALIQNQQKGPAVNFAARHFHPLNAALRGKMFPPPNNPPIAYNRFQHHLPQPKVQLERITQPSPQPPARNEEDQDEETNEEDGDDEDEEGAPSENEEDEEEAGAEDADDDEDQTRPNYDYHREDDHGPEEDSKGFHYEKYHYDDDHYNGRYKRRHKKEDETDKEKEHKKSFSKSTKPTKTKKTEATKKSASSTKQQPERYDEDDSFKYSEGYSTVSKYETPPAKPNNNKSKKKPKGQYFKKTRYQKVNGKPKVETIEGRYSELVPVTHKHKFYKEKWYVTKSTADGANDNKKV